ncbi:RNA ligase (ATP) [Cupriavidus metallidurans]|uniref:RNA ligase (ATP) n=1 Tax=Cupriavidus metallidurans TaxID=119219 RepID=UPI001CD00793|nr:RNA ligase (ATP) [Cupriavidus metallidurans]UBM12697.1 RNA ligase (ATP) [Cupriavidus metallidurans]
MSQFECPVVRVHIEPHPNADAIEIARVGDFQSIVKKGQFKDGDLAVYLPEASLLPEWMLKELGMWDDLNAKGKLHGKDGNRIKAIKLRGVLSQGITFPVELRGTVSVVHRPATPDHGGDAVVAEGSDVAEFLGVTKYEPIVPANMAGKALGANLDITHKYDFENIKKHPNLFEPGDDVVITEKIHGTLLQVSVVPSSMADERFFGGRVVITSKGLGGRGIILDHNDEGNVYAQAVKKHKILEEALRVLGPLADARDLPMVLFGEVFGAGIQDLSYGAQLDFRAFDISIGVRDAAVFVPHYDFEHLCDSMRVNRVPQIYVGPFDREILLECTDGKTTLAGGHIREGVVVKSRNEDRHPRYGRKIAKSISEAYLLRKNATEFQ